MKNLKEPWEFLVGPDITNYGDLKTFLQTLTPEQLEQPVRIWGENMAGTVAAGNILNCDFIDPSGDGAEPRGYYDQFEPGDPDFLDGLDDEDVCYPKGTIMLALDDLPLPSLCQKTITQSADKNKTGE
jgi:hypothetical protein